MLTDSSLMPFGPHKYKPLREVPADYLLRYLDKNSGAPKDLRQYVREHEVELSYRQHGLIPTPATPLVCTKVPFSSQAEAKRRLGEISKVEQSHKKPVRSYECPVCGFWHHTSQPIELYNHHHSTASRPAPGIETQAMNAAPPAG